MHIVSFVKSVGKAGKLSGIIFIRRQGITVKSSGRKIESYKFILICVTFISRAMLRVVLSSSLNIITTITPYVPKIGRRKYVIKTRIIESITLHIR